MANDVVFEGIHARMKIERPAAGVVVLRIDEAITASIAASGRGGPSPDR